MDWFGQLVWEHSYSGSQMLLQFVSAVWPQADSPALIWTSSQLVVYFRIRPNYQQLLLERESQFLDITSTRNGVNMFPTLSSFHLELLTKISPNSYYHELVVIICKDFLCPAFGLSGYKQAVARPSDRRRLYLQHWEVHCCHNSGLCTTFKLK